MHHFNRRGKTATLPTRGHSPDTRSVHLDKQSMLPPEAAPGALASLDFQGACHSRAHMACVHRITEHDMSTKVCQGTF